MINKKRFLGKTPEDLGDRDAIHVAIASVRAACLIQPGQRCTLNADREAVPDDKGVGIADPWRKEIRRGDTFWLLLNQDEVPNVQHVWEHPKLDFSAPKVPAKVNRTIDTAAKELGIPYGVFMDILSMLVESYYAHDPRNPFKPAQYSGPLSAEELDDWLENNYLGEIYDEWAEETGFEFDNDGSDCCPEYDRPPQIFATE